jgi:nitrate reductase NapE component
VSAEKVEKKVGNSGTVPENKSEKKKSVGVFSFVAIILFGLLALAVISVFLNNQKLHKQMVAIERQVASLEAGDKAIGNRVLALEDELVVISLKGRLAKLKGSLKGLLNLQALMADNQELVAKVQGLVDELSGEEQKLVQEIAGTAPKVFQASRPCPQPCYQRCPEPVVIIHPPLTQTHVPASALAPAHGGGYAAPKAKTLAVGTDPNSWWSKFFHLRLFGN